MSNLNPRRFNNPGEAVKELQEGFNDWSAILTKHSIETALAVIAANWAVYGDVKAILDNSWSKWSLAVAVGFLGINLVLTGSITFLYNRQRRHADTDKEKWKDEYEKAGEELKSVPWPYTDKIQCMGSILRFLKVVIPMIAATLFIVSIFVQ
jgi:hypothetical protein